MNQAPETCLRVYVDTRPPQILIASEAKIREWIGDKQFERLCEAGAVEEVEFMEEEGVENG